MNFEVGHLDFPLMGEVKYIVTREEDTMRLDWMHTNYSTLEFHRNIASHLYGKSSHVIGGGYVENELPSIIHLYSDSGDFGGVPKVVLDQFAHGILTKLQGYELSDVIADEVMNPDRVERWLNRYKLQDL